MSTPKRHHFVPQFYLRRFSLDGRSIGCFYKKAGIFIPVASIKGQCAIDNYYSWSEEVEPMLGIVEGRAASIIRTIAQNNKLPDELSTEWQDLLMFVAIQFSRTRLSGDDTNEMADYFGKLMAQGAPELDGINLDDFQIKQKFPAAVPMEISIKNYDLLNSLGRALLINNTQFPFICSDNPVIFYNSQRSHLQDEGVIGLNSTGLQIFFPIDSNRSLYLYDKIVYSNPTNVTTRKIRLSDSVKINLIHYMWSDETVYCFPEHERFIRALSSASRAFIPYERTCYRESSPIENEDGTQSTLLHNFRTQAPIETDFSFAHHEKNIGEWDTGIRNRRENRPRSSENFGRSFRFDISTNRRRHLAGGELKKALNAIEKLARQSTSRLQWD